MAEATFDDWPHQGQRVAKEFVAAVVDGADNFTQYRNQWVVDLAWRQVSRSLASIVPAAKCYGWLNRSTSSMCQTSALSKCCYGG